MPTGFLTDAERERFLNFPQNVSDDDVNAYFTLSPADRRFIPITASPANRLGQALVIGTLRFLGHCPDVRTAPTIIIEHVARQLRVPPTCLARYAKRRRSTVASHNLAAQMHLRFRRIDATEKAKVSAWLVERALEHESPVVLFELACDYLLAKKLVRPGLSRLERIVAAAKQQARVETYRRVQPLLTRERRALLDALFVVDKETERTPLTWIRQETSSHSPRCILAMLDKLRYIKTRFGWVDVSALTPNNVKVLAQTAYKSSSQAIAAMPEERKYPILLSFMHRALEETTDAIIKSFDECLGQTYSRAGNELDAFRLKVSGASTQKVRMLRDVLQLVVDKAIKNFALRGKIIGHLTEDVIHATIAECDEIIGPEGGQVDYFATRYSHIRTFAPAFLAAFEFRANQSGASLMPAIDLLRELNATGQRKVPDDAPMAFIPETWRALVLGDDEEKINRRIYELCLLWQLRAALRSGDIWVEGSRRYASLESYLIPKELWHTIREDVCAQVGATPDGAARLEAKRAELEARLKIVDERIPFYKQVRIENGELVVPHFAAEDRPTSLVELEKLVDERLPRVELCDGNVPRAVEFRRRLHGFYATARGASSTTFVSFLV